MSAGGAERVASELANFAVDSGIIVSIITMNPGESFYHLRQNIRHRHPVFDNGNKVVKYLRLLNFIRKEVDKINPDVVFALGHAEITGFALLATPYRLVRSPRVSPLRVWKPFLSVGLKGFLFQKLFKLFEGLAAKRFDGVIFQSSQASKILANIVSENASQTIIPNFLPQHASEIKINNILSRKKEIVSIGRLTVVKNQEALIRAVKSAKLSKDWIVRIVGDGEERQNLEYLVDELGLTHQVVFEGFQKDVGKYLENAQIFVLPSQSEGYPNALLEAMAYGLACVSFDCVAGPSDLIEDGVNGFLVEPENIEKLGARITELAVSRELREKFSEAASEVKVSNKLEIIAQRYLDFLFELK